MRNATIRNNASPVATFGLHLDLIFNFALAHIFVHVDDLQSQVSCVSCTSYMKRGTGTCAAVMQRHLLMHRCELECLRVRRVRMCVRQDKRSRMCIFECLVRVLVSLTQTPGSDFIR